MISLLRKVKKVERLNRQIDQDTALFKMTSGLHCLPTCGHCCEYKDIDSTILEILPFAYSLFIKGEAHQWLELAKGMENNERCMLFFSGLEDQAPRCRYYEFRPLLCRLFGFAAMLDKNGKPVLITCNAIKEAYPSQYHDSLTKIQEGEYVPIMKNYYFRLNSIDMALTQKRYPINQAIRYAIEEVLFYFTYRKRRVS